jgi:alkylation response protein AidB-like acyl-CoA dehydrogenase
MTATDTAAETVTTLRHPSDISLVEMTVSESAAAADAADGHPFVARVAAYAEEQLRPNALEVDRSGVSPARIRELAELGLLNHAAPAEHGGASLGRAEDRRLHELVSAACFNTWLVWAQHAPLVARVARSRTTSPLTARILSGDALLGAGISDVRRFPERYVEATRVEGGWRYTGTVSWVTGWGLHAALNIAGVATATERVVTALVPVGDRTRPRPLDLSVVAGSRTERVELDGAFVTDEDVLGVQSLEAWRREDVDTASDARPHHFGLAHAVLRELEESGDPAAATVASTWAPVVAGIRSDAYRLSDEAATAAAAGEPPYRLAERLILKVAALEAVAALTRALVVARAGHGLTGDDTAQLHARSGLFVQVQGQSASVRRAHLDHLAV